MIINKSLIMYIIVLKVIVNGSRHCTFNHRIPLTKVTGLFICGDVNINFFGFMDVSKSIN